MTEWLGGVFGQRANCVLAPNASAWTLDGTNTWVLREPGGKNAIVVDPGPSIAEHLDAIAEAADFNIATILLTHWHHDHSESAKDFASRMKADVRALDPALQLGGEGLKDGDVIAVDGLEVHVVATPGHTTDSLSFFVPAENAILTGDTVLGRGTTVIDHPDGSLGAYLDSMDRLHRLAEQHEASAIWPGHGPVIENALGALDYYISHRQQRLEQVRAALVQLGDEAPMGDALIKQVVEIVYADVDPVLWGAAEQSLRAQLAYLGRY